MSSRLLFCSALLVGLILAFGCLGIGESAPAPAAPDYNAPPALPPATPISPGTPEPVPANLSPALPLKAPFEMAFLNVSFADSTLLRTADANILFDAGSEDMAPRLVRELRARGVDRLNLLILSSNDPAMVGGAVRILQDFPIDEIWITGMNYSDPLWQSITPYLATGKVKAVRYGDSKTYGALKLQVLNPSEPLIGTPDADSIALKVSYGSFCSLLFSDSVAGGVSAVDAGTVTGGVDSKIISGSIPIQCPVLKVSAHGSANAASFQLLEKVKPEQGIISVGPNPPANLYPQPTLLRRLILRNTQVWTTDRLGTITVSSDGLGYTTSSQAPRGSQYGKFLEAVANGATNYWTVSSR